MYQITWKTSSVMENPIWHFVAG